MTDITVSAITHVVEIKIVLPYGFDGNIQGTVQALLTAPEGERLGNDESAPRTSLVSEAGTIRQIADAPAAIQEAVEALKTAVSTWVAEDKAPPDLSKPTPVGAGP